VCHISVAGAFLQDIDNPIKLFAMRFFIFIVFLLLLTSGLYAQWREDNIFYCGYKNARLPDNLCPLLNGSNFVNDGEAEVALNWVMRPIGLTSRNFMMTSCPGIENVSAITPSNGLRYIVYDPRFLNGIREQQSDWASSAILAHEIGHHLLGHTLTGKVDLKDSRDKELQADEYSGWLLYKLGATLEQAQQAVMQVASEEDDTYSTHPKRSLRLAAIRQGWEKACKENPGCGTPTPPPPIQPDLINFVLVEGGFMRMGSDDGNNSEKPVHQVKVSNFYLAVHELTFDEYDAYCDDTGATYADDSGWGRGRRPVINVSWFDAVKYCNWRSEKDGLQKVYDISGSTVIANREANGYRLPTEAEWEFAARSRGKNEKWAGTSDANRLSEFANGSGSQDGYNYTAPVGSFDDNDLGLFDMSGNVWELCWDWYGTYSSGSETNPVGPGSGSYRVLRGGSWYNDPSYLRCAFRYSYGPDIRYSSGGFRLARAAR
jgi:formylglycine-generating enzyme required for sulfatase activity